MPQDYSSQINNAIYEGFMNALNILLQNFFLRFWYFWIFLLIVNLLPILYRAWKFNKAGIADIDRMTGQEFELFLDQMFKKLGYVSRVVGHVGDSGADLITEKDKIITAVQAKVWKGKVGVTAIQEIVASKPHYGATAAMVVTNSYYTDSAKRLARENGVALVDRSDLVDLIIKSNLRNRN